MALGRERRRADCAEVPCRGLECEGVVGGLDEGLDDGEAGVGDVDAVLGVPRQPLESPTRFIAYSYW